MPSLKPLNRLEDPSLRFLLWLEWILLGITALRELGHRFQFFEARSPLLSLMCLLFLGLLGLRIPRKNLAAKIGYATLNLALVVLAAMVANIQLFFLLCIVLMIRACLLFERKGRWLTMAGMLVLFLVVQGYRIRQLSDDFALEAWLNSPAATDRSPLLGLSILFVLVLLFLQLLMNALLSERRIREKLTDANAQLRRYALQVEEIATLQERTRIAREIHDSLGHSLTALNLNLSAAVNLWEQEPSEAQSLVNEAQSLSRSALQDVRQSVATLRSEPLQGQALPSLIQDLANQLQQTTGIQPTCKVMLEQPIAEATKLATYRIVQEALTNITKYAEATTVDIQVSSGAGLLQIRVRDNGKGFEPAQTSSGFGLRGMEERAIALGGTLKLETSPGQGCCILVELPLKVHGQWER